MDKFLDKTTRPPKFKPFRLFKSMWRQKSKTPLCPDQPRLDGKLAIVTGGNNGIGYETSRGLVSRGAEVIILARNRAKSNQAINNIKNEFGGKIHYIPIDLADITSIISAVEEIALKFPEQKVDILVANAGVAPKTYSKSSDGYELSFAINVLGHHMLLKFCHKKSLLNILLIYLKLLKALKFFCKK